MKVLFVGAHGTGIGWGNAGIDYMMAMDTAGIEVVSRGAYPQTETTPDKIREFESRDSSGCDIVIQNILPSSMDYNGSFKKNIGLYFSETSHFRGSNWAQHLNLMSENWVTSHQMVTAAQNSYVGTKLEVVPIPCDTNKYTKYYQPYEIPELRNQFVFYTIGELTTRKNIVALLKAFHLEFNPNEPVSLLIKGGVPGKTPEESGRYLQAVIQEVKTNLKLYPSIDSYSTEIIITQRLTDEEIMRLHNTCDCFVMTSRGEAWNIPAFDAMAMGKTPICTDVGGMHDFLTTPAQYPTFCRSMNDEPMEEPHYKMAGWLVPGYQTNAFGEVNSVKGVYRGDELWTEIDISALRSSMREAYTNKEFKKEKILLGIDRAYDYSYEVVGKQIRELLERQV